MSESHALALVPYGLSVVSAVGLSLTSRSQTVAALYGIYLVWPIAGLCYHLRYV